MSLGSILLGALLLSISVGATAAILAWREKPKPGSRPLTLLLLGQIWWSVSIVFRLEAVTVDQKLLWMSLLWVGVGIIPFGWVLFAIEYTGRHKYLDRKVIGVLAAIPLLTTGIVATSSMHDLFVVTALNNSTHGILQVGYGGVWYWVVTLYTYTLGLVGIIFFLDLLISSAFTFRKQALALSIGVVVPWTTNVLYITELFPEIGIDPTPIAFSISGVLYLFAIKRYRLLRQNPAPTKQARRLVFDKMQEGAIVVDFDENIVDVNRRALEIFGFEREALLGADADEIIPSYDQMPHEGTYEDYIAIESEDEIYRLDPEATVIRTRQGRTIGRVITFKDVTGFLHQQQRLEVLNRVLRHNIRTETNLILGFAEVVEGENADRIKNHARRIEEFGDKGREAIQLFDQARSQTDPRNLDTILGGSISTLRDAYPELKISYRNVDSSVSVESILDIVIQNVIENAVKHNKNDPPKIWIAASVADETVTINIADNGPGIDEYELSVLAEGSETSLKHGSGFGLWIVKWGVDLVNGTVSFRNRTPTGTVVTLQVPNVETSVEE